MSMTELTEREVRKIRDKLDLLAKTQQMCAADVVVTDRMDVAALAPIDAYYLEPNERRLKLDGVTYGLRRDVFDRLIESGASVEFDGAKLIRLCDLPAQFEQKPSQRA